MQRRSFLKRVSGVVGAGALGVGRVTASQEVAVQTAKTAVSERTLGRRRSDSPALPNVRDELAGLSYAYRAKHR